MIAYFTIFVLVWQILALNVQGQYRIQFTPSNPMVTTSGVFSAAAPAQYAFDYSNDTCAVTDYYSYNTISFAFTGMPFALPQVYIILPVPMPNNMMSTPFPISVSWGYLNCPLSLAPTASVSQAVFSCTAVGSVLTINIATGTQASICNIMMYSFDQQWAPSYNNQYSPGLIPLGNAIVQASGPFSPIGPFPFALDDSNATCASTDANSPAAPGASLTLTFTGPPFALTQAYIMAPPYPPADMYSPVLTLRWGSLACAQVTQFSPTNTLGLFYCSGYGSTLTIDFGVGKQTSVCNILLYSSDPQWAVTTSTTAKPQNTSRKTSRRGTLINIIGSVLNSMKLAVGYMADTDKDTIHKRN